MIVIVAVNGYFEDKSYNIEGTKNLSIIRQIVLGLREIILKNKNYFAVKKLFLYIF